MNGSDARRSSKILNVFLLIGALLVLLAVSWQAIAAHGAPDPEEKGLSPMAMATSSGILVFREGLEAILVLAAVTAGVVRNRHTHWRAVLTGVGLALAATVVTWFVAVGILSAIDAPALSIQAGTGLVAILVLLVVMNWFFHKIYWTGWIGSHSKRKKRILTDDAATPARVAQGLALLGFTAVYREGFEIVLFLQNLRLKAGTPIVLGGAGIGLALTAIVGVLAFVAHQRLPYKKMLVLTGAMLAVVLLIMVGEQAQEMQQAGWIPTHELHLAIPDWIGTWFAVFPNVEGLVAQLLALVLVVGSYAWVRLGMARGTSEAATRPDEVAFATPISAAAN